MSLLVTGLLVLVVLCESWIQSADAHDTESSWKALRSGDNSVNGLSSLDEVRGNGSMLLNVTTRNMRKNDLLFPSLNFTCNGTIERLTKELFLLPKFWVEFYTQQCHFVP